jgi:hypothetical protein
VAQALPDDSLGCAIDEAKARAEALGHQLRPWSPFNLTALASRCARCSKSVWAGRRGEIFGPAVETRCGEA